MANNAITARDYARLAARGLVPAGVVATGRTARHEAGRMNKTEARYADRLVQQAQYGNVAHWWFEPVTFRLARKTRYTPDFMVLLDDGSVFFDETKGGFIRDDAMVKIKVAAEMYPLFTFRLLVYRRGEWTARAVA